MGLSSDLISQFVKITQDKQETKKETTAYGKIIKQGDKAYVQLDGSDLLTPITTTTVVKDDDRVLVTIKDHTAIVTGNITNPSASDGDVQTVKEEVTEIGNKISEFEIVIADKVTTEQLEAEIARIDKLIADEIDAVNGKFETIEAKVADIDTIKADIIEVSGKVTAHEAEFETIRADIADFKHVTTETIEAIDAEFRTLKSDYADFKVTTTDKLIANEAKIKDLEVKKLDTETADIKYANIDFANITEAAVEKLFADSGIIKDLIVSDGKITGELVGVTIKGDLIEANTLKADKLVILGEDGLYYKLNVNSLGETVASSDPKYQNGLDGSVIVAESITAEKIAVDDLVAFKATIGGYHIDDHALYSGVKNSIDNTTRGVFLGDDGQFAVGDSDNFLKFFKDSEGNYKLEIKADTIRFGSSGTTVDEVIKDLIKSTEVQYYLSDSTTSLSGGSWQNTAPEWAEGKYMWSRTKLTRQSGKVEYLPSENGTCIAGATGQNGSSGEAGADGKGISEIQEKYAVSSSNTIPPSNWKDTVQNMTPVNKYLWYYEIIKYTDGSSNETSKRVIGVYGDTGPQGPKGENGNSISIKSTSITYQASNSGTEEPKGEWTTTIPELLNGQYLWTKTVVTYSDGKDTTAYSVSYKGTNGQDGQDGTNGQDGASSYTHIRYSNSSNGSNMSTDPNGKSYIGIYTGNSQTAPSSPLSYTWSKFKGDNGQNGSDGNGIKSMTYFYGVTTSQTPPSPETIIGTNIPTLTSTNKYLWQKEVIDFTDQDVPDKVTVTLIAVYGDKGDNGQDGKDGTNGTDGIGVKSTEITYQVSNSGTEEPKGEWSLTIPQTSPTNPYLWTKTKIIYTDDTESISYSVGTTTDGIIIGGRNYIYKGSGLEKKGYFSEFELVDDDSYCSHRLSALNSYETIVLTNGFILGCRDYEVGSKIVYSYDIMFTEWDVPEGTNIAEWWMGQRYTSQSIEGGDTTGQYRRVTQHNLPKVGIDGCELNKWYHVEKVMTIPEQAADGIATQSAIVLSNKSETVQANITLKLRNVKIEYGTKATDWTPAPEDTETDLNDLNTNINNVNDNLTNEINDMNDNFQNSITEIRTSMETQFEQTNNSFEFEFNKIIEEITNIDGTVNENYNELIKYIRFVEGNIILGEVGNQLQLKLSNERLAFLQNDEEVAYISDNRLYIYDGEFLNSLTLGRWVFVIEQDGGLSLNYV